MAFRAPIGDVERIFQAMISVTEVPRSRCKGPDDKDNPHRRWIRGSDWKSAEE